MLVHQNQTSSGVLILIQVSSLPVPQDGPKLSTQTRLHQHVQIFTVLKGPVQPENQQHQVNKSLKIRLCSFSLKVYKNFKKKTKTPTNKTQYVKSFSWTGCAAAPCRSEGALKSRLTWRWSLSGPPSWCASQSECVPAASCPRCVSSSGSSWRTSWPLRSSAAPEGRQFDVWWWCSKSLRRQWRSDGLKIWRSDGLKVWWSIVLKVQRLPKTRMF